MNSYIMLIYILYVYTILMYILYLAIREYRTFVSNGIEIIEKNKIWISKIIIINY